jgi:hypothetical protein
MNLSVNSITGDLDIQNGQLVLIEGQEEIKQHLEQRLRAFLGEWFLDQSIGLPYFDDILKKNVISSEVESIFINEILSTPGVVRLLSFELTLDKGLRQLQLSFLAETIDGIVDFSGGVP